MPLGKDIIQRLDPDTHYAVAILSAEDLRSIAWTDHGIDLDDEECADILRDVDNSDFGYEPLRFYLPDREPELWWHRFDCLWWMMGP